MGSSTCWWVFSCTAPRAWPTRCGVTPASPLLPGDLQKRRPPGYRGLLPTCSAPLGRPVLLPAPPPLLLAAEPPRPTLLGITSFWPGFQGLPAALTAVRSPPHGHGSFCPGTLTALLPLESSLDFIHRCATSRRRYVTHRPHCSAESLTCLSPAFCTSRPASAFTERVPGVCSSWHFLLKPPP